MESHGNRAVAEAFLEFLRLRTRGSGSSPNIGFRPVKPGVAAAGLAARCRPSSSRWPTWAAGPRLEQELYGPKGIWTSIFTADAAAPSGGK